VIVSKGNIQDRIVTFEIGKFASLANGIVVSVGNTSILCTVVVGESNDKGFLALNVNYIENFAGVGKIPGGFKKREGVLNDHEIITSRIIDRSLRSIIDPLFSKEIQIFVKVLSYDGYATDVLAVSGCSLALNLLGVTNKLVSAAKLSNENLNSGRRNNELDFFHSISNDKTVMLEIAGIETPAIQDSFGILKSAYDITFKCAKEFENLQKQFIEKYALPDLIKVKRGINLFHRIIFYSVSNSYLKALRTGGDAAKVKACLHKDSERPFSSYFSNVYKKFVDKQGKRLDGSKFLEIRPIRIDANVFSKFPAAVFQRGQTQVLASLTRGTFKDAQMVETIKGFYKDPFMVHYNFLPFCVNHVAKVSLSRREVGHGELAKKALKVKLKTVEDETLRITADVLSCDGSSSMATICAASLVLKNDLRSLVAGITVGMFNDNFIVDLSETEDAYLSEFDCKIAGTYTEITAMQFDIKQKGINASEFEKILEIGSGHICKIIYEMEISLNIKKNSILKQK
jgi:polyribonucleotide nucleotidyltransferase